ncbi:DUF2934 domain-containing protein [Paraburkholderia piptadeniae]|nr:DUF2934 domain-containing protein [Paraburkholderia piptadeniae]
MATQSSARSTDDLIRERAYHLWEQDNDPKKHANEYWDTARRQIESEGAGNAQEGQPAAQSVKRHIESEDPQEGNTPHDDMTGKPRAKRTR